MSIKKLNLDPSNVMNRVLEIYGSNWEETDKPAYYREEEKRREEAVSGEIERLKFVEKQIREL